MRKTKGVAPFLIFFAVFCALIRLTPLGQAIELGSDEGFELAKAFLVFKGFHLYSQIWNDQPPLLTECLSSLFKIFGPSILVARMLTVGFSFTLLMALYDVVRRKSGRVAAWGAVVLLFSAPWYLQLSTSVMQEVPAFSLGMWSVLALVYWESNRRWFWLVLSGAFMGVALLMKFTPALLMPAIGIEIFLATYWPKKRFKTFLTLACQWAAGMVTVFVALAVLMGLRNIEMLVGTHIEVVTIPGMSKPSDFAFPVGMIVMEHWEAYLGAAIGIAIVISRRLWREALFPVALLATVSLVHWLHRPWWNYYYLHHAIPLAWLSSIAVREAVLEIRNVARKKIRCFWQFLPWGALLIALAAQSALRVDRRILYERSRPTVATDVMLAHVDRYREQTKWIYAQPVIYAFHARLPVPPELAVVARKRYWSGQMTWRKLLAIVEQYKPEQLLLYKSRMGPEWTQFLGSNYVMDYDDGEKVLYVLKSLKTD